MAQDNPKGYTPRTPDPELALRMFNNKEALDLNQLYDLLRAKFGDAHKLLTVKALKAQLKGIEQYSKNLFCMDDYRIPKHRKLVFPYELCCILLPLIQFKCTSRHETFDVGRLLAHYDQIMNYISTNMDESNREYLYAIPIIRNYRDGRTSIMDIFNEAKQLNSLMLRLLPQTSPQQLPHINEEIRSLRQRCYFANLTKSAWVQEYIDNPQNIVRLLNHRRATNNQEPSSYPGLDQLLQCLTADNIDDVLMHYFIYKSITLKHTEKDVVTRDELFMIDTILLNVLSYPTDVPEHDKTANEHFKKIQLKASQMFDKDDAVEHFLYEHLIDMAKLLLLTKGDKAKSISTKAKSLYTDALKTNLNLKKEMEELVENDDEWHLYAKGWSGQ